MISRYLKKKNDTINIHYITMYITLTVRKQNLNHKTTATPLKSFPFHHIPKKRKKIKKKGHSLSIVWCGTNNVGLFGKSFVVNFLFE